MFKKPINTPLQKSKLKSSATRALRNKLLEQFPLLEPVIEEFMPKKGSLEIIKGPEKVSIYALDNEVLFYQDGNEPLVPSLKIVHKYPSAFPTIQVDRGAIRFVLSGAQLMAPGLTSPGGRLPDENIEKGRVVAINAEGKEHAVMVAIMKMPTDEIKAVKKGVAVEGGMYLGDGLWNLKIA